MIDLEIPLNKRSKSYRFFEMLPAFLSYGMIVLLFILSWIDPVYAAIYILLIVVTVLVKLFGIILHTNIGYKKLIGAQEVDWNDRLLQLENSKHSYDNSYNSKKSEEFGFQAHRRNLLNIASNPKLYPKPSSIYNIVIIPAYNEAYELIEPTIESLGATSYNKEQLIIVFAYEQRGGKEIKTTAKKLQKKFSGVFKNFLIIEHPSNLPNEIIGKGGNITYAGIFLKSWVKKQGIPYKNVIITTLDSDNRPHKTYFDYLTYEYIVHKNRKNLSYQPVSLFLNNIWDAPAPMRVIATGNSFWNIISSMRPHTLRNFASHSQPLDALVEMGFWSTRTIVEDGHQYWRSYVYFEGDYSVTPIYVPIYQDAVLAGSYYKTLKAQFVQLQRWAYGASDIAYIATKIFSSNRRIPLNEGLARLIRLIDGHVTLATIAVLVMAGGWVPLFFNANYSHSIVAHQLPEVIAIIQRLTMLGILFTIFITFKMLPPRPQRYKRHRNIWMVTQWLLMPITSIIYMSWSSYNAQTHLLLGKYLDKFNVTEKSNYNISNKAKSNSLKK